MADSFKESQNVTKEIVEMLYKNNFINKDQDKYQANVSIHPHVHNLVYKRENEVIEAERLRTIIILSKTLDIETATKAILALGYRISIDKPKDK